MVSISKVTAGECKAAEVSEWVNQSAVASEQQMGGV